MKIKIYPLLILSLVASVLLGQSKQTFETNFRYQLEDKEALEFHAFRSYGHGDVPSLIKLIKIDRTAYKFNGELFLANIISHLLDQNELKAISSATNQSLSETDISIFINSTDTIITFNPDDYTEEINIALKRRPELIFWYGVQQEWTITDTGLRSVVKSISPIRWDEDPVKTPWEYLKIPYQNPQTLSEIINNEDVIWIKTSESYLPIEALLQDPELKSAFKRLFWDNPRDGKISIYDYKEGVFHNNKVLDTKFFEALTSDLDTIIAFDPETFEETKQIVRVQGIDFDAIHQLLVFQAWYFDDKTKQLGSILLGAAPVVERFNESLGYEQNTPLYLLLFNKLE